MKVFAVVFLFCAAFYAHSGAVPSFSIAGSNVPDIRYELNAVQTLAEAYVLYPNNTQARAEAFADLYGDIYNVTNGWNVAGDCDQFYTSKSRLYVDINVIDPDNNSTKTQLIKIFN